MLTVRDLRKSFQTAQGRLDVLRGIDLDLARGETLALTGESGSGKSTLLHLIGALDSPDGGQITFEDERIDGLKDADRAALRRSKFGLVFQQFNLVPSLKVLENLTFQARLSGRHDQEWTRELTERLGLGDVLDRYPEQLSGGQQQRVAIGRTLAARPSLLLADEPTGNLDEATGDAVIRLCLDLVARAGCGFLMVTHSIRLADLLDRRVHLQAGLIR